MEKAYNGRTQSAEWLEKAIKLKTVILAKIDSMPEALRTVAPSPNDWSASGMVEHLVLLEENVAGPWRQRLLESPSQKVGIKANLVSRMISIVFTKTKLRVPTVPELEPKSEMTSVELKNRWDTARAGLVAALPNDDRSAWILHPALGPLSSEQMGRMIVAHLEHHLHHWPNPKG